MCFGPDIINNSDPMPGAEDCARSKPSALLTIACDSIDAGYGAGDGKVKLPVHWQCCGNAPTRRVMGLPAPGGAGPDAAQDPRLPPANGAMPLPAKWHARRGR